MTMQRYYAGSLEPLGDREIGVVAATDQLARDGHVLVPAGMDLSAYRRNPIVLWQHDPTMPVATCTAIAVDGGDLVARIQFAPAGASQISDQACALTKSGIVRGISVGFDPQDLEPLDPRNPRGGQRITRSELLEISIVSVPADTGAGITARGMPSDVAIARMRKISPVPVAAMQRAGARVTARRDGKILSHAGHVWTLQQLSSEKRKQLSYEARQADLRRLGGIVPN